MVVHHQLVDGQAAPDLIHQGSGCVFQALAFALDPTLNDFSMSSLPSWPARRVTCVRMRRSVIGLTASFTSRVNIPRWG